MKLVFVLVSLIAAIMVDCRSQPGPDSQHSIIAEQPQWPDLALGPEDSDDNNLEETTLITAELPGFTLGSEDSEDDSSKETTSSAAKPLQWPGFTIEDEIELEDYSENELRGGSCKKRKEGKVCLILGGFCVARGARCYGRREPDGCKGSCDCCVPGCSEELGFFSMAGSNQCFKLFKDQPRNWTDAHKKCRTEGLELAHPYDAISLRSYIIQRFGHNSCAWVNARGNGTYTIWQDNGELIMARNPLWYNGFPPANVSTTLCLRLLSFYNWWYIYPSKPYATELCSRVILNREVPYYALCELKME